MGVKKRCVQGSGGGDLKGKKQPGRLRRKLEDNKIDLKEIGYKSKDWTDLACDRDK
jgi:hypothetical protein